MTLLERFDNGDFDRWTDEAVATVRRALAVAQAVEDGGTTFQGDKDAYIVLDWIMRRADEMLGGQMSTLLKRWDAVGAVLAEVRPDEIRQAIVDAERLRAENANLRRKLADALNPTWPNEATDHIGSR